MAKGKSPESQPVGNTDDSKRGRSLGGAKFKAKINNETTLKEVKDRQQGKK